MIAIGIILIIGAFVLIMHAYHNKHNQKFYSFGIYSIIMLICGYLILRNNIKPTEGDVRDGRAEYIESIQIVDNDTIRTYKIKWI